MQIQPCWTDATMEWSRLALADQFVHHHPTSPLHISSTPHSSTPHITTPRHHLTSRPDVPILSTDGAWSHHLLAPAERATRPQGTLLKSAHSLNSLEACDVYMKRVPTQWNGYRNCLWNCESVPNEQQQQPPHITIPHHHLTSPPHITTPHSSPPHTVHHPTSPPHISTPHNHPTSPPHITTPHHQFQVIDLIRSKQSVLSHMTLDVATLSITLTCHMVFMPGIKTSPVNCHLATCPANQVRPLTVRQQPCLAQCPSEPSSTTYHPHRR